MQVSANNILIGMEGPAQSFSTDEENLGMHLVIKHVNAQGGIHGRKIEVAAYPRGRENIVEQALENVQRLNEEDLVFLLFNFGGPAAVPIGEYAMHNNLPYLFPHTALLTVDGDRHVFTSFPRYAGESRVMLRYLAGTVGAERIAVIHADNIYGDYFAGRARELAGETGYTFVGNRALDRNPQNALAEMQALRDENPDVLIMALYPAGAKKVVEAKAAMHWDIRLVSSGPLTDEQYPTLMAARLRVRSVVTIPTRTRATRPASNIADGPLPGSRTQSLFPVRLGLVVSRTGADLTPSVFSM